MRISRSPCVGPPCQSAPEQVAAVLLGLGQSDTQVQQLQTELRHLNQTLIVKQNELTQLNRDNASLVGEVGEHTSLS